MSAAFWPKAHQDKTSQRMGASSKILLYCADVCCCITDTQVLRCNFVSRRDETEMSRRNGEFTIQLNLKVRSVIICSLPGGDSISGKEGETRRWARKELLANPKSISRHPSLLPSFFEVRPNLTLEPSTHWPAMMNCCHSKHIVVANLA